ncbi:MAG: hypothetical protein Q4B23_01740 [Helcococcus sp.]|nr:hypothetical protein [Helcococcus sp.]
MKENNKNLNKYIYRLLIISFFIILVNSLESFIHAKSNELVQSFIKVNPGSTANDYLSVVLINYFMSIVEAVIITIFTVFTYKKYAITKLYKFIFGAIVLLRIFNTVIKFNFSSVFYFLNITLYILLFILIITAPITKRKVKNGLL